MKHLKLLEKAIEDNLRL